MLTHHLNRSSNAFILLLFCCLPSTGAAREPVLTPEYGLETLPQNPPSEPLPLGTLLDSEGKPLAIPAEQSALEYSPSTVHVDEAKTKQATKSTTAKKKMPSRKQQLASRDRVANDPSCRWLNARMSQLETQIGKRPDKAARYQIDELSARQQEWQCLKCGAEGPNQDDHYRCQYRR